MDKPIKHKTFVLLHNSFLRMLWGELDGKVVGGKKSFFLTKLKAEKGRLD